MKSELVVVTGAGGFIGGALISDLALQLFGVTAFLLPTFLAMYSLHWFRSRRRCRTERGRR